MSRSSWAGSGPRGRAGARVAAAGREERLRGLGFLLILQWLHRRPAQSIAARHPAATCLPCIQLTLPEAIEGLDGAPGRLNPGMGGYIGEAFRQKGVQLELFKEPLRYVRDFGCGIVATETGSLNPDWSFHPGNHSEKSFRRMLAGLEEMVAEVLHAKDFRFEGGGMRSVPLGRGKLNYRLLHAARHDRREQGLSEERFRRAVRPARQVLGPRRGRGRGSGRGMARSGVQVQPGMEPIRLLRLRAPASISIMRGVSSSTVRPGMVRMRCTSALGRRPSPT